MSAVTATNVRAGRAMAVLAGVQSAKGTPVTDFSAATAGYLWDTDSEISVDAEKAEGRRDWMTERLGPATAEGFRVGDRPTGVISVHATPGSLERLIASNWGAYSAGTFTLETQVAATRWLTVALMESLANANGKLVRISDAWVHRLALRVRGPRGILEAEASFAGEAVTADSLPVGGVTLPGSFSPDRNVFAGAAVALARDPAGLNVGIRLYELDLVLDQGLHHEWDGLRLKWTVYKTGRPEVTVRLVGVVSDETWAILTDSRAGTKRQFRLTASAPSPAKTLTINLYEMDFTIRPMGREGNAARRFEAIGRPHVMGSSYVTIALA